MVSWGIVTTVKAPLRAVANFAAWHLELGAARIYLHLDAPDPVVMHLLKAHPRIRVTQTGDRYWQNNGGRRPVKHQVRQTRNASRVLARTPAEVDWLAHIDVDEFLLPDQEVASTLAALPDTIQCARMRPLEALAPAPGAAPGPLWALKAMHLDRPTRRAQTERLFPDYARGLDGGFLSHVAGKLFVRTTLAGAEFRIHNLFQDGTQNPGHAELAAIGLCHMHAPDAETWLAHYRFRHERGSYRPDLKPPRPAKDGGLTLHQMLASIEAAEGEAGLRRFFEHVCTATPALSQALRAEGLLRMATLDLDAARARHFPDA
ncbi:glycosyltransferase family 2 protein [Pseudooceanicola sp.]|uniref:glycosyltransferase family 2 protein n=1 Tax=Pseudooceanicola sp. TaxID=1914328 RepID=UPI002624285C|nr:glycosyltransferase family 2 protein [Pseudooceanicola sp.]MDF1854347.1 glycosyltransferase family 2 protein [Pseudooceanicola sp.]